MKQILRLCIKCNSNKLSTNLFLIEINKFKQNSNYRISWKIKHAIHLHIMIHWNDVTWASWHLKSLGNSIFCSMVWGSFCVYRPSQCETTLHYNSHWLGTYTKWSLMAYSGYQQSKQEGHTWGRGHLADDSCRCIFLNKLQIVFEITLLSAT